MTNGSQPLLELSQTPILYYIQGICTMINDVLSRKILFTILVCHFITPLCMVSIQFFFSEKAH